MPDEDIQVDENTPLPQVREAHKRAVERANAHAEAAGRVPRLERENALLRAKGDPDSRVGRLLLSDDDLDWTDRDAVAAAWSEVSPTAPPAPPAEEEEDPEAIDRQERHEALHGGGTPPGEEPDPDPREVAYQQFHAGMKRGRSREKAMRPALETWVSAAANGDERVIFDPERWRKEVAG